MALNCFGLGLRILHLSSHGESFRKSFRVRYLSTWLFHSLQITDAWYPQTPADLEPINNWLLWKSGGHITYEEPAPSWWRSISNDTSFETLPTFQDSVCPRCTCVHCGAGWLEGSVIPASTMDQLYGSQLGRTRFLGAALWFLLFLDAFHCYDWSAVNNHSTRFSRLCKSSFVTLPHVLLILFSSTPCRLYICCISSSDKENLSLLCHWSWLRPFMAFKFWSLSWDESGIWLAGWSSTSLQFRRFPSFYRSTRFGEWTISLGGRLVWFLENLGRGSLFMYAFCVFLSLLQR